MILYDDTNLSLIPANAQAVAGYVNGRWPTYPQVVQRWPNAKHLSIDVTGASNADCLDVERGDATNAHAGDWVKRQLQRGVHKPVVYTSLSNVAALLSALAVSGVTRSQIRLWTAHYDYKEHLCSPQSCPGFGLMTTADATQWTNNALGRSLDQSLLAPNFFGPVPVKPLLVHYVDKDGIDHYEQARKHGWLIRAAQFDAGKFEELNVKRV